MNLTLNDFRSLLGQVNDGNVVFTRDGQGVEKANHGGVLSSALRGYRKAPNDPEENRKIRNLLMDAILNSQEGKSLDERQIRFIRFGLGVGIDRDQTSTNELSRTELKLVFESIDSMLMTGKVPEGEDYAVRAEAKPELRGVSRMIARQVNLLDARGFNSPGTRAALADIERVLRETPAFTAAENMVKLLPHRLNGIRRADVSKFVRNNFLLVQSQVFDRLFWMSVDEGDVQRGLPQDQRRQRMGVDPKRVLLDTLTEMMTTYGAKKVPMPRVDRLLARVDRAQTDDPQAQMALNAFRTRTGANLDALFARPEGLSGFETRQFTWGCSQLRATLEGLFLREYAETAGSAVEKSASAEEFVCGNLPDFLKKDPAELAVLLKDSSVVKFFQTELLKAFGDFHSESGRLDEVTLRACFDSACAAVERRLDLTPLAKVFVEEMSLPAEKKGAAVEALLQQLATAKGEDAGLVAELRLQLMRAHVHGEDAVANQAMMLKDNSEDFRAFAEARLAGFADPETVRKLREKAFAQYADSPTNWNPDKTLAQALVPPFAVVEAALRKDPAFTALDERAQASKLAQIKATLEDKAFAGQICLLHELDVPGYADHVDEEKGFGGTLEAVEASLDWVRAKAGGFTQKELDFNCAYVATGLASEDKTITMAFQGKEKNPPFLKMLQDGTFDFVAMDAKVRSYLARNVQSFFAKDLSATVDLEKDAPEGVVQRFKDEFERCARQLGRTSAPDRTALRYLALNAYGFGTVDAAKIRSMFAEAGLDVEKMATPEGWYRAHLLTRLLAANGFKSAGLIEWSERVTGKAFADIDLLDCLVLLDKCKKKIAIPDPLDKLEGAERSVARFLGGEVTTAEAGLVAGEMPAFLDSLRTLASGVGRKSVDVTLFGQKVTLEQRATGTLTARFADGTRLPLAVARTTADLVRQVEDEIVTNVGRYGADIAAKMLPAVPKDGELVARPRELYSKALSCVLGMPSVNFAHLSTANLARTAQEALVNPANVAGRFAHPPVTYNDAETVELQQKLMMADRVELSRVQLPPAPVARTLEQRRAAPPDKAGVHALVADLLMNSDTWAFDVGRRTPGLRLQTLLGSYGPEIGFVYRELETEGVGGEVSKLLATLPDVLREPMKAILHDLGAVDPNAPDVLGRLAAIETRLDAVVETAMTTMQQRATALFSAQRGEDMPLWQKGLDELTGASGLDAGTPSGRFTKAVLDSYFARSGLVEKRAMLASLVRNADAESGEGRQVAELLKGAGPLLQKTLQGLPIETFGPETQLALKDMKSNLLPIPDTVIRAQLLEMMRSSNGEILSIEVKRSIGQATVGQALLCHIRTKTHPVNGEDVVVKLLRPNVRTAIQREHELFMSVARELDGQVGPGVNAQQLTFQGQYESILREFDFTLEADNIDRCLKIYNLPGVGVNNGRSITYGNVHSMDRVGSVPPMTGMLVLQKVEGGSADRLLEKTSERIDACVAKVDPAMKRVAGLPGGPTVTTYVATSMDKLLLARGELDFLRKDLAQQHAQVTNLLDVWIERALFGNGTFHNDLHAGNVMVSGRDLTVIDFGNVMRLDKLQQQQLVFMFTACIRAKSADFLDALAKLLPQGGGVASGDLRKRLEGELAEVFAKGTALDVLPRLLGALAVTQRAGVAVPDAVQNFVQSMARLQGVVSAFETSIRQVEAAAANVVFSDEFAQTLAPRGEQDGLEILNRLDRGLIAVGDPANGSASGIGVVLADEIVDEASKNPARIKKELEERVFKRADGGVGYLRDVCTRYRNVHGLSVKVSSNGAASVSVLSDSFTTLDKRLDEYENARTGGGDDRQIAAAREKVVDAFLKDIAELARRFGASLTDYSASVPRDVPDFVTCVGRSLTGRSDALTNVFVDGMGIDRAKFREVMRLNDEDASMLAIGWAAGKDIGKFMRLKAISDDINDANKAGERQQAVVKAARGLAERANAGLPAENRVSFARMRALDACAHDFRCPMGWRPSLEKDEDRRSFREVLAANVAAARRTLNAEDGLQPSEIAYFAHVFAAESNRTGLLAFVKKNPGVEAFLADEKGKVERGEPGADADLVKFLEALRRPEVVVPNPGAVPQVQAADDEEDDE